MKKRLCIAILGLVTNAAYVQVTNAAEGANLDAELAAGKQKADQNCANCHGLYGQAASGGNSAFSPKLTPQNKDYLAARLNAYRSGAIQHPQMSLIAQMISEQDIENVSAWYASIPVTITGSAANQEAGVEANGGSTAKAAAGKNIASQICSNCHGLDGQAIASGSSSIVPSLTAQQKEYMILRLREYKSGKFADPLMSPIAKALSDQDIENVATWYSGIEIKVVKTD
ncbi:MAG: c-type cytochrome [Gammaproteobacteria bacterium]|nr:c-type cytochrome [Gammaproteobacteria bacterium]